MNTRLSVPEQSDMKRGEKLPFSHSEFWNELMEHVFGKRQGGAKVIVDAEDAKTGLAKTSAAVAIARACASAFDYELTNEDFTLSGLDYLSRYNEHPSMESPSVIVLDELVGAGAGDARRAMASKNIDLARAWQLMRTKRVVTICTLPDFSETDKRLKKLADFRVQTLRKPFGAFRSYDLGTYFTGKRGIKFRRLDKGSRLFFPDMASDGLYEDLAQKKNELLESEQYDADVLSDESDEVVDPEDARREERIEIAQELRDQGNTLRDIADVIGMSRSWVGENTVDNTDE